MPFCFNRPAGWLLPLILLLVFPRFAEPRDHAAREKQLTERVEQFYRCYISGDWKTAETLVRDSSRNIWLREAKGTIETFHIDSIKIDPGGKRADVTATVGNHVPHFPSLFEHPHKTEWIYEKKQWFVQFKSPFTIQDLFKTTAPPANPAGARE